MAAFDFGEDFGQKVDLTASIRNILRNYPEGTAILKELVQNADDAGASTFSVCLDCRQHGTEKVADRALAQFQGPALLAYNSGVFTDRDFQSIQRIGDSLKKTADDQNKIGRFGIGFNAVYHLTDLPSFVSAGRLVMLDPQARFLPHVNPSNPGKMVDWIKNPQILEQVKDQFAPYHARGKPIDWKKPLAGTVFRLPLRTPAQGSTSSLSKRALSVAEAEELLESLRVEASAMLLFLKNVDTIEISYWAAGAAAPITKFHCTISNLNSKLRQLRGFVGDVKRHKEIIHRNQSLPADFSLVVDCTENRGDGSDPVQYQERWEVCNQLGGEVSNSIAADEANELLRLVPWGGVAACVHSTYREAEKCKSIQSGLAYCFLPLPVQTGLPVMVNGFFELSSNRRDVWQAGSDMTGDGQTRAQWNLALMRDIVAPSYMRLLTRLRDFLGFTDSFQKVFPDSRVPAPWSNVVESCLELCARQRLLEICCDTGRLQELIESRDYTSNKAHMQWPSDSWINCADSIVLPEDTTHELDVDEGFRKLCTLLVLTKSPVVLCSRGLNRTLTDKNVVKMVAKPSLVRSLLKKTAVTQKVRADETLRALGGFMLKYCLSDYPAGAVHEDLNALPVLPMCDGNIGQLRVFTQAQASAIDHVMSMGFSATVAIAALNRNKFNLEVASEALVTGDFEASDKDDTIIIVSENLEEMEVFIGAASILLDNTQVGAKEKAFLVHEKMQALTNVRPFQAALVPDLLRRILPKSFYGEQYATKSSLDEPTMQSIADFLKNFWAYAAVRPDVVEAVQNSLCIVPSQRWERVHPLSKMAHLLVPRRNNKEAGLSSELVTILETVGVNIVETTIFSDVGALPEVFWGNVDAPTREGVLAAIERLIREKDPKKTDATVIDLFATLSSEQRETLRLFLTEGNLRSLGKTELEIIKLLPIFRVHGASSCNDEFEYTSLAKKGPSSYLSVEYSGRKKIDGILLGTSFLQYTSAQDLSLLRALGVEVIKPSKFYLDHVLKYPAHVAKLYATHGVKMEECMLSLLSDMSSLCEEMPDFAEKVVQYPFLLVEQSTENNEDVKILCPSELYDPREPELVALLLTSFFPAKAFRGEDTLVILSSLGMKQALDWDGVIACATMISEMPEDDGEDVGSDCHGEQGRDGAVAKSEKLVRSRYLLRFLDKNIDDLLDVNKPKKQEQVGLFGGFLRSVQGLLSDDVDKKKVDVDAYVQRLQDIRWVPTPSSAREPCMPWPENTEGSTALPRETRPVEDAWMCSAVKRIVVEPVNNFRLRERIFCWKEPIAHVILAQQLKGISHSFEDARGDYGGEVALQSIRETITGLIPQLYSRLNTGVIASTQEDRIEEAVRVLQDVKWIWVGDGFVSADKVALTVTVNATPYLYQLPQDLQVYSSLLDCFRVKNMFEPRDYVRVLATMAQETGQLEEQRNKQKDASDRILKESEIDLACQLVTLVSTEGSITAQASKGIGIYIPDNTGKLGMSVTLMNDDVPWMSGPQYVHVRKGRRFIHPNISTHVADKLGVKSLRLSLVNSSTESNAMFDGVNDEQAGRMEAFGQAESLTSRLKTILDMYPDGNPIFSELIQNADDAGASTVRILIDENTYGSESLLDTRMSALQGPSLLVYNDAVFSEADFRSLARIGQGGKLNRVSATGRFGLGFNSTYHLTDTPTFVSGDYMVVFDPHCLYAPGASTSQPGLKIRCHGNSMATTFPDQFEPYRYFGCDFGRPYKGTLFRFPLRNQSLARTSEISSRSYGVPDVEQNLDQLIGGLSHYLLFLRSVKTIEVYRLPKTSGEMPRVPELLHKASASGEIVETENNQRLLRYFDRTKTKNSVNLTRDEFYSELLRTSDDQLPLFTQRINVQVQSFIPGKTEAGSGSGGTHASKQKEEVEYLILNGLRGGEAKRLACDPQTRHLKLIPLGGVAACLSKTITDTRGEEITEKFPQIAGQAFVFLPLPIQTKMPVHCNAYFELSSNRRDIWRGEDTQGEAKLRSDWNVLVMRDVLAPLYRDLLMRVSTLVISDVTKANSKRQASDRNMEMARKYPQVMDLLPCPIPPEPWSDLSSALFQSLREVKLLFSQRRGGQVVSPSTALLIVQGGDGPDKSSAITLNESEDEARVNDRLESILLQEDLATVRVSRDVLKALVDEKVSSEVTPSSLISHFSNDRRPHRVTKIDAKDGASSTAMSDVIFLLQYCFRDINRNNYATLHGLPLLPLEDGTLGRLALLDQAEAAFQVQPVKELFVVSDAERMLMQQVGGTVVAHDSVLGATVSKHLRDAGFSEVLNVKKMSLEDLFRCFRTFIPPFWYDTKHTVVNRLDVVSDTWLKQLWSYLIDGKHISLLEQGDEKSDWLLFPLLPIVRPSSFPPGDFVAKVTDGLPVLHMSFKDSAKQAAPALVDLGIHIFDPSPLGSVSYSSEIARFLSKADAKGVLAALNSSAVVQKNNLGDIRESAKWDSAKALGLRDFVLDEVLSKVDRSEVSEADMSVLKQLPVWQRHGFDEGDMAGIGSIDAAADPSIKLPPSDVNVKLIGKHFFRLRNNTDRRLYSLMGVETTSRGDFYARHLVPAIEAGELDDELVDDVVVDLLKNLAKLETESEGLTEQVKKARIIRNDAGELCAPSDLYDSSSQQLWELLPLLLFPASTFRNDRSLMLSLREVGLRTTISREGVLFAAKAIEKDYLDLDKDASSRPIAPKKPPKREKKPSEGSGSGNYWTDLEESDTTEKEIGEGGGTGVDVSSGKVQMVVRKAINLLRYLELNIETLAKEEDPEAFEAWIAKREGREDTVVEGDDDDSAEGDLAETTWKSSTGVSTVFDILGGRWGEKLRSTIWIPVYTEPPVRATYGLPWPRAVHASALATPANSVPQDYLWQCSSTSRISAYEIKSDALSEVLGFCRPIPGRNAALQLLNVKDLFESASESAKASFRLHSGGHCIKLLETLDKSTQRESPEEVALWSKILKDKPVIWLTGNFIESSRLSFRPMAGVNTEPFLFTVTSELKQYRKLMTLLGVRETFGPVDLASVLRQLYHLHATHSDRVVPLSDAQLQVALGILRLIVSLVSDGDEVEDDGMGSDDEALPEAERVDTGTPKDDVAGEGTAAKDDVEEGGGGMEGVEEEEPPAPMPKVSIEELGIIYAPDRNKTLTSTALLTYDDAAWISSNLVNKNSHIKFVHQFLTIDEARILGARSLREQLFAGSAVVCPDSRALKAALNDDGIVEALADVLGVADSLGATTYDLLLDSREHPTESLMHPGLSEANGPAVLVHIKGPSLSSEDVVKLLTPSRNASGSTSTHEMSTHDPRDDDNNGSGGMNFNVPYPVGGKKLIAAFAVTDCLQILTGKDFFVFDPCGTYLFSEAPEDMNRSDRANRRPAIARAQRCDVDLNMLSRFPDQFLPFLRNPFDVAARIGSGSFDGVILRMPLRKAGSVISGNITTTDIFRSAALCFRRPLEASIVFSNSIASASCGHFEAEKLVENDDKEPRDPESPTGRVISERSSQCLTHYELHLQSPLQVRNKRRQLLRDKGWKKAGLGIGSLFSASKYSAPEDSYVVTVRSVQFYQGWIAPPAQTQGGAEPKDDLPLVLPNPQEKICENDWRVVSVIGAGRIKDEALKELYRSHRLPPFATLAVLIRGVDELEEPEVEPMQGMAFCNGCPVGVTGWPFHVEGPFIQDTDLRIVPLLHNANTKLKAQWNDTKPSKLKSRQSLWGGSSKHNAHLKPLSEKDIENWNNVLMGTALEELGPKILSHCVQSLRHVAKKPAGWYKYWPFLKRMSSDSRHVAEKSRLYMTLAEMPYYLTSAGFNTLNKVLLPASGCPDEVVSYMESRLPLGQMPPHVAADLRAFNLKHKALNAVTLRDVLRRDAAQHCNTLRTQPKIARALLDYCLLDLEKLLQSIEQASGGPDTGIGNEGPSDANMTGRERQLLQKSFAQLAGVPLLPMSDGSICPFPQSRRARLCLAPYTMHALLPSLARVFVHPTALEGKELFKHQVFLDTLHLSPFNTSCLKDYINIILPPSWMRSDAIRWQSDASIGKRATPAKVGRGVRDGSSEAVSATEAPSEALLYVLWKDVLQDESITSLEELSEWPLLPVLSGTEGRRLLIAPHLLFTVFFNDATPAENDERAQQAREVDRLTSVRRMGQRNQEDERSGGGTSGSSKWAWIDHECDPSITSANPFFIGEDAAKVDPEVAIEDAVAVPRDSENVVAAQVPTAHATELEDGERASEMITVHVQTPQGEAREGEGQGDNPFEDMRSSVAAALAGYNDNGNNGSNEAATEEEFSDDEGNGLGQGRAATTTGTIRTTTQLGQPTTAVLESLQKLGAPLADRSLLVEMPRALKEYLSRQHLTQGKRVLDCLSALHGRGGSGLRVECDFSSDSDVLTSPGGTLSDTVMESSGMTSEPLLRYSSLTYDDRITLLNEIYMGHVEANLSDGDLARLKELPLFTSYPSQQSTSLSEFEDVYYCTDEAVLQTLKALSSAATTIGSGIGASSASYPPPPPDERGTGAQHPSLAESPLAALSMYDSASAVIIVNDSKLLDLYRLLKVEELTEASAVRKFIVPALNTMSAAQRVVTMRQIASRWDNYKDDKKLVDTLKTVAFVPSWDSTHTGDDAYEAVAKTGAQQELDDRSKDGFVELPSQSAKVQQDEREFMQADVNTTVGHARGMRRASEVFSWKNWDLLDMLSGEQQARYFNPEWLRDTDLHTMMLALDMPEELTKDNFISMARDIEAFAKEAKGNLGGGNPARPGTPTQEISQAISIASRRGRRLLRYAKDNDRSMSVFDMAAAKVLGKIAFVPVYLPSSIETGGHVEYAQDVCRFSDVVSPGSGALAFSVMPVLADDITPPALFHSALGITSTPSSSVVLAHLYKLTTNGKGSGLDRWNNNQFSVPSTFGQIFEYLGDHWATIAAPVKEQLCYANIVPVGHMLIRPGRLFFRLTEDLSPFMHEVPRTFGVYEKFLKHLGVKETPSARDYCRFLQEVRDEGGGQPLNANELKAIIMVITSISQEGDQALLEEKKRSGLLYVPNQHSVLQPSSQCLVNDDNWLRRRAAECINSAIGMEILHPSIPHRVAKALGVLSISEVFIEQSNYSNQNPPQSDPNEIKYQQAMRKLLNNRGFLHSLSSLLSMSFRGVQTDSPQGDPYGASTAAAATATATRSTTKFTGLELLNSTVSSLELRFVQRVPTRLTIADGLAKSRDLQRVEAETENDSLFFFDAHGMVIYIDTSQLKEPVTPEIVLSVCICKLIGLETSLAATVATLMKAGDEAGDAHRVMDAMQIGIDSSTLREKQRGLPGERLTDTDTRLLELKPFRIFRVGEVVAVSQIVTKAVDSNEPGWMPEVLPDLDPDDLRYAHVISTGSNGGSGDSSGMRKVQCKVDAEHSITLLSTLIYSFQSARDQDAGSHTKSRSRSSSSLPAFLKKKAAGGDAASSPPYAIPTSQEAATGVSELTAVNQKDVVGAINGLLLRAGIPMSLEERDLVARVLELESTAKRSENELQMERTQHSETREHLTDAMNAFKCQVCLTNDYDHVLVPCGHPICGTCMEHLAQPRKCPFCRSAARSTVKVFLPEVDSD